MNCSLPYLGTCWSQDHSGESSVGSSRSTQSSMLSTDASTASSIESSSLALDDWDIMKARSLSTDISSPVPMDSFMPFLFPMDPDAPHHTGHPPLAFGVGEHQTQSPSMDFGGGEGMAPGSFTSSSIVAQYVDPKPEHQTRVSPVPWQFERQQQHQPATASDRHFASPPPIVHSNVAAQVPMLSAHLATTLRTPLQQLASHPHPRASPPTAHAPSFTPISTASSHMIGPVPMVAMGTAMAPTLARATSGSLSTPLPLADIQLLTKLNQCYWKNGRKNLQCFPICPEHNDFYSMKMSNRKHTSVGVCRGPVYSHVFLPACAAHTKPSRTTGQHMKYEFGVGASGSGGSAFEVFVLGKFERVPQRDENNALQELLPAPEHFMSSSAFEGFRYGCFQAVEMEERRVTTRAASDIAGLPEHIVRSTWFFLPDVWKVQPMLKKKRKATRSAPAQSFPFCFRVFVYTREPPPSPSSSMGTGEDEAGSYRCLATAASSFFELYSTRTVDRVKRKYWGRADDEEHARGDAMDASMATTPSSIHIAKRASRA